MFGESPGEEHILYRRCRGDGDSAVGVRLTDQHRRRRAQGFEPRVWRGDDGVDVQSDWLALW